MTPKEAFDHSEADCWPIRYAFGASITRAPYRYRSWFALIKVVAIEETMTNALDQAQRDVVPGSRKSLVKQDALLGGYGGVAQAMQDEEGRSAQPDIGGGK